MPQVIIAAAITVGFELAGGATLASLAWAKVAFSAGLAFVGEVLRESPSPLSSQDIAVRKQLIRASAEPRRAIYGEARVSGTLLYPSNGSDTNYVHFVIAIAGHACHAITEVYLGDEAVGALDGDGNATTGRFAGFVRVRKYLGSTTQAMDADLATECPDWGAKDRPLKGVTYVYLRLKRDRDVFPSGIPTPRFDVEGKSDILDVRTGTVGYTTNAALCTLDYILWEHGFASDLAEVEQASWIAAANVCDEDVTLPAGAGGGTQKRYAVNGSFTLDRGRAEILDSLRQAMAGAAFYTMGLWSGHAGAASAPVMDISEKDLRGPFRVRPRVSDDQVYNAVKGTYTETTLWTETDFPPVTNATYEAQDGGQRISKDVRLPFEIDAYRAQRLAKTDLERHRQGIVVEWPMRIRGLKLRPWNVVRLSSAKMVWTNKLFRIVEWKFNLTGGPDLVLEEYADAIYTWSSLEATLVDPAPDTTLPSPFEAPPPTGLSVAATVYDQTGLVATLSWTAPVSPYRMSYAVRYWPWPSGAPIVDLPNTEATSCDIRGLEHNQTYVFSVASVNHLGVTGMRVNLSQLVVYPTLPAPASVMIWGAMDSQGNAVRMRVKAELSSVWAYVPDGIQVNVAVFDNPNELIVAGGGTGTDLTIGGAHVLASGSNFTVLAGSDAAHLVVTTETSPFPTEFNLAGMFWVQFGASQWRKATSNDATTLYFADPFDIAPTLGETVNWVELSWFDGRGLDTPSDLAANNRLAALDNGSAYEVIRWSALTEIAGVFHLTALRAQEGTSAINADGLTLHYYPAPGAGTQVIDLPKAAFVGDPTASVIAEADILIPVAVGQAVTITANAYRNSAGGVIRSHIVPAIIRGML